MVLQKQLVQLPFEGLQTKVDPKVAPLGSYAQIDNMIMNRYAELVKRDGTSTIGQSTVPANINSQYSYLNEVGVITNNALYSYSSSLDQYLLKGKTASPIITAKPIISNTYSQSVPDSSITTNNILGVAWEDSRGGVYISIKDLITDTFILSDTNLTSTAVKPKVVAVGTRISFLWIEPSTTSLQIMTYNTINNSFSNTGTISSIMASCYTYDAIVCANAVLTVAVETTAAPNAITGYFWNVVSNEIGAISNGYPTPASLNFTNSGTLPPCISIFQDSTSNYLIVTIFNDTNQVYTKAFYTYLGEITTETPVGSATTDPGYSLTCCVDTNNNTYIFASTYNTIHTTYSAMITNNITSQTQSYYGLFYNYMSVASKAMYYSGNAYVILAYTGYLQNTYFGVTNDGACWGRMFYSLGNGAISKANCATSLTLNPEKANTYIAALLKTTEIVSSANSYFSVPSVYTEQIYFTPYSIDNKVLGRYLNIAGGYLKQYDGSQTVFEQGFHLYPQQPTLTQSTSTGSLTTTGTYSYLVVWEWKDNQGQIHRSNTSVPSTITLTGANNTVTVTVNCLPITNKETRFSDLRTPVIMAVYRTQSLGTAYYRVNQLPSQFVYNDPTALTLTFTDTFSDDTISSNSLVYNTGGVFDNITLPATNLMCVAKNRVICAGTDSEPNQIYVSKQKEEGVAIEFSNELSIIVDSLGGDITALAAMDDKILIFKKSLLYYVAGEGPDPTGSNGSFTIPLLVASDCGCVYPQSIVLTGMGIMFLSQKGIYLCDRQLNVTYIGQPLDAYTTNPETKPSNFQVTSAVNLPDQNQVYFTTNQYQALVYDTYFQLWYTHTFPFNPVSSTILNNQWYVSDTSVVYQSQQGLSQDGNIAVISSLQTNWISMAQLEGYSRIYSIMITGDNASLSHTLVMKLYYDFEIFPREILTITPSSLDGDAYGVDSPYGFGPQEGSGNPYGLDPVYGDTPYYGVTSLLTTGNLYGGGFDGTYQFMARPKVQKCSSIRIEIFDQFPTGSTSQSFKFTGLSIIAGIKQGWNKNLPYNRRLTSP